MQDEGQDLAVRQEKLIQEARRWLEQRKLELKNKEAEYLELGLECNKIDREIQLLETWMNEVAIPEKCDIAMLSQSDEYGERDLPERDEVVKAELRGDHLRREVVKILEEVYPEVIYYREILKRLEDKGFQVGGKDPGLNLVAHLAREPRAVRAEKRGMYRLGVEDDRGMGECVNGRVSED
ncbi:MAG: hypothetical protein U9N81_14190 [Bacillota bacterium]|nr:hypothetical protein [Bacillota bacterium]